MVDGVPRVPYMIAWIVIIIGFPLTLLAIYALYSLVQDNHVAPVYVINLLISDLIQMCCFVTWVAVRWIEIVVYVSKCIHFIGVMASVGFMVCVSLERYLVVARPLWYRFKWTIKFSVAVSIMTWAISVMDLLFRVLTFNSYPSKIFHSFLLLFPFPLLIFFLVGTLRALSAANSVPITEKRRIVGILVSVLPLADLILYIFMRKGAIDKLLAHLCSCKMAEEQQGQVTTANDRTEEEVSPV
ncbi:G-protein coupled receptor 4-like [Xyrichtys novacula]|uniref:G-protein coupled receptor 4-like n=1 Tax=Xyrichtys novacula TaxID=13765 RepID=A0AAV1G0S9_XYRNO|nr:G-protein coupled receptor 4-like [Xyrichtys novacula]